MASRAKQTGKRSAAKRMVVAKKTAPARKPVAKKAAPAAKASAAKGKSTGATAKTAATRPVPTAGKPQVVSKPSQPAKAVKAAKTAKPSPSATEAASAVQASAAKAAPSSPQQTEERRKAATRKFFARLRSLEAIVGADLRKRGSLVLMQAVDQWYSEAVSATATDVSITNAAKVVIGHL